MARSQAPTSEATTLRIRESALREVEKNGIIGLRIADVAAGANCSVALVYKYFGDRDNLLAEVLGNLYRENLAEDVQRLADYVNAIDPTTAAPEMFARMVRPPTDKSVWQRRHSTLRILAASLELPPLHERLSQIHRELDAKFDELIRNIQARGFTQGTGAHVLRFVYRGAVFGNLFYEFNEAAGPTEAEWLDLWTRFMDQM